MVSHGDNREPARHHELNPNQSSQKACSLATPDVNTCCSFAYGNEEGDSKSDREKVLAPAWALISVGAQLEFVSSLSFVFFLISLDLPRGVGLQTTHEISKD